MQALSLRDAVAARRDTVDADSLRILHVFPSFAVGGVEVRIADIARKLGRRYVHTLVTLSGRTDALDRVDPDNPWTVLPAQGLTGVKRLRAINRALASVQPGLLCTYNFGAMDWALANRFGPRYPHLHFESGFGSEEAAGPMRRRSLYRRVALARTNALVVPSQKLLEIARRFRWVEGKLVHHVANGVDLSHYRPGAAVDPLPELADQDVVVVAIAPLRAEKRLDRLITIFARAVRDPSVKLVICGHGPCRQGLEALAASLGVGARVRFAGQVPDVRAALQANSVLAMTSMTEQMPNALLQAMAMSRPVVAFDAGDIARILPASQPSQVFDQDDAAGFADALSGLLDNRDLRGLLGQKNRRRVETAYRMDDMARAYDEIYTSVAEGLL